MVGPAHAGKVALLLERFLEAAEHDPWLIVPTRGDVDRVERELVARRGALLAGTIGTFDRLFEWLAGADGGGRRVLGDAERALLVRRVVEADRPRDGQASARFPGYAEALAATLRELESGLVETDELEEPLATLARTYRSELDRIGVWDRGTLRRRALERLTGDLGAWGGSPVLAYGFEDLTGAEWRLLEALAARAEVHVSLPYEPGRAVYASLARTAEDLAALAAGSVVELPPRADAYLPAPIAHLERALFTDTPIRAPLDGSIRFLEGAGERATFELVAEEALALVRAGAPADRIGVVCPSVESIRASLATAFTALGVPFAIEGREPLRTTPFGQGLLSLLRFAWVGGERPELYGHLRTPYSGLARRDVDWVEGKLRGRGVIRGDRVVEVTTELRGGRSLPPLELALSGQSPTEIVRRVGDAMLRNAHRLDGQSVTRASRRDLRAHDAAVRAADELDRLTAAGVAVERGDVLAALERATVRTDPVEAPGRVAVLDLLRARTRRFDVVFVVGLEQGTLPRRPRPSPFLDDEARRGLDDGHGARLVRPDAASRDRYLFATACTRARERLYLVRQATGDEGSPREASPFWEAVRELFDENDVRHHTTRRPLSALTRELEAAPTERERLRALAGVAATDPVEAEAIAVANGWERRLRRAQSAFSRRTAVTSPRALELLGGREAWSVSELERMASCSSAWFVERYLRPGTIDRGIDRMMRGSIMHAALQRFYAALPSSIPGAERVTPENADDAVRLVHESLAQAIESGLRIDADDLARRELEQGLRRDLELFVREEAVAESPFVPRRLEVSFRGFELAPGVAVSGKIDRVDVDPWSARGLVADYKSGAASSAADIRDRDLLQVPLYMLVLRDQLGLEPMGGVYIPVGGGRARRGMLRGGEDAVPGFARNDYLDPDELDGAIEEARATAVGLVERIRAGDVRHDPKGGECPHWCDLWRMCRKARS